MTFGLESSLPTPFSSAAVMIASKAQLAEVNRDELPLVGTLAGQFEINGIAEPLPLPVLLPGATSGGGGVRVIGLGPAAPPTTFWLCCVLAAPAKANCEPISRENDRLAATTRASISTCCDLRSSCRIRLSITGSVLGISRMIRVFERLSAIMSPRDERNFLRVAAMSVDLA